MNSNLLVNKSLSFVLPEYAIITPHDSTIIAIATMTVFILVIF